MNAGRQVSEAGKHARLANYPSSGANGAPISGLDFRTGMSRRLLKTLSGASIMRQGLALKMLFLFR